MKTNLKLKYMKTILGLDLGTNSIGWAVIQSTDENKMISIKAAGSRIIPMDAAILGDFNKGNSISQTAERTRLRSDRRLRERCLLRRERLNRVLRILNFLPKHYVQCLDRYGKILKGTEPKLAWVKGDDGNFHFLFPKSFEEMINQFIIKKANTRSLKVPYDWTLFYLRKKALYQKIEKEELAWILLNFNQKRGYYQQRDDEDDSPKGKLEEFYELKVVKVEATEEKRGIDTWYNIHLENGWIYRRPSRDFVDWEGKTKQFIVTTDINNDGTPKLDKNGDVKRSFRVPKEDDWTLIKKKTERDIILSKKTVGEYIYDSLLENNSIKIKGALIRTIERHFYKDELVRILSTQKKYHYELNDCKLYNECIEALYQSNESYRESISKRDFVYLFVNDIIFYHRPLKSKKHLISDCKYELRYDEKGNRHGVKSIAKSHPLFAEFRIWQFIDNLKIYANELVVAGQIKTDVDVTNSYLKDDNDYLNLFKYLYSLKSINQNQLLTYLIGKKDKDNYRWNYVDKDYTCNETRHDILKALKDCNCNIYLTPVYEEYNNTELLNEVDLWHILYSVDDKEQLKQTLANYGKKRKLPLGFSDAVSKIKPYKKEYGAYSLKAIKKLLPLMRRGSLWDWTKIDDTTKLRIERIINGEFDENIAEKVREKAINLQDENSFKGLPLWLACYIVYNRYSEGNDNEKWNSPEDIKYYVKQFKQHSLRNPIVEQVLLETLRTVADIWEQYGKFDEIHIELGRELKNPADKRAQITASILENENTNLRIRRMLQDFMNPEFEVDNVRPDSPTQQELLKIYEEYAINSCEDDVSDDILNIRQKYNQVDKSKQPTKAEALKYRLWLEQGYRSPYTGEIITLSKLFTTAYEIEHIIPQSRYFDDSISNKVICESEVNKLKDNKLGYEFIKTYHGQRIQIGTKFVEIFEIADYEEFVRKHYGKNQKSLSKLRKLLMDDIPDGFIERQLNDSRYISKLIKGLLSKIVRDETEMYVDSKNLILTNGAITDRLKKEWGINDKWNELILPRFIRLNNMTGTTNYTFLNGEGKLVPQVPLNEAKGFNKKRIDHRHHAMDAIVIACTTRNHINLLNNEAALSKNKSNRYALQRKLRRFERKVIQKNENGILINKEIEVAQEFILPWITFPQDVYNILNNIIVTFKTNNRIINKTTNKYLCYDDGKKIYKAQCKGNMFVVRKPMHKGTVFGAVNLKLIKSVKLKDVVAHYENIVDKDIKEIIISLYKKGLDGKKIVKYLNDNKEQYNKYNLDNINVYYFSNETKQPLVAVRKDLVSQFSDVKNLKKAYDIIEKITDIGIQQILKNHIKNELNVESALSPDGIDRMNSNIKMLNNGKYHEPIKRVRFFEIKGEKFKMGQSGITSKKYVEAAKGTNLFYAVYCNNDGKRNFETIPLSMAILLQKQGLPPVPEYNENGDKLLFYLSPNDLVYVPTTDEIDNGYISQPLDTSRIYKAVSFTGHQSLYIIHNISSLIKDKYEFSALNKIGRAISGEMIQDVCIPINVDRLGRIISTPQL